MVALPAHAQPDTSRLDQLESELDQLERGIERREGEVEELDARARQLRDEEAEARQRLEEIEGALSLAVERYNEAVVTLETVQAERASVAEELDAAVAEVAALEDSAIDHARRLHKMGPTVEFATFMGSEDPSDLGFKGSTLQRILTSERSDLEALAAARINLDVLETRLAEQEAAADAAAVEVEQQVERVEAAYAEHEDELAELTEVLEVVETREAAERDRLEQDQGQLAGQRQAVEDEREAVAAARERYEQERREQERQQAAAPSTSSSSGSSGSSDSGSSGGSGGSAKGPRKSAQVAVDTALAQVGKPYKWGATGPGSYDCSGLTSYAWRAAGVSIPRTSGSQYAGLTKVSRSQLQPGDLVFYYSPISHVAMYIGNGMVVEAARAGIPVRTASLSGGRSPVGYARP